jgi:hypothetical protein
MSEEPLDTLDGLYFTWLYGQVGSVIERNPSKTYWKVLKQLHSKEFVWFVPNDDNRAEDGRNLRIDFLNYEGLSIGSSDWIYLPCSMLELLIALAQRVSFNDGRDPRSWFWHLMENLDLERYNDNTIVPEDQINDILDEVIWRTYRRNGQGGLFPLKRANHDQTKVELWDQMHAYLLEQGLGA